MDLDNNEVELRVHNDIVLRKLFFKIRLKEGKSTLIFREK